MENILKIFTASHNSKKHNKKRIILAALFFLIITSFLSLNAQWAKFYTPTKWMSPGGYLKHGANSIRETSDGGYIVAGYISFLGGEPLWWILKLSAAGDIEWSHPYGWEYASSIQQTNDEGYIVAGLYFDHFDAYGNIKVLKLSSSGDIEWSREYGTSEANGISLASSIQQTNDEGYIVAGNSNSFSSDFYDHDLWILKLFSDGGIEWQRTYGGSGKDSSTSIQQTGDGGYIAAGTTESFGAGEEDIWILKLSSSGDIEWEKTYGESSNDGASFIQQTSDGGYVIVGYSESFGAGERDIWILKLDQIGNIEWQHTYGGSNYDAASSIHQTSDGGYVVGGYTNSFGAGEYDLWILKLSSTGDIEWQRTFGGNDNDVASSIQQTRDSGYIVAGTSESFGSVDSVLILKLKSDGNIPSCKYIAISNAKISDTHIIPQDTNAIPQNTNIAPQESYASLSDVDTTISIICPQHVENDENVEKKGPCFIATAAYGSPLHPHLDILGDFRDKCLMPSSSGRKFVSLYYKYSPFAANLIAKHKVLKIVVRIYLVPLVAFSYSMLHFGPIIMGIMLAFIFMLPIVLFSLFCRKLRRFQKK